MKAIAGFSCYLVVIAGLLQAPQAKAQGNAAALPPAAQIKVDFSRDIEPIFRERCQSCHGPKLQSGGFRLDTRAGALAGGYSGLVIKPGASAESKLIRLVAGLEKALVMPLAGPRLTPEQVGLLRAWIDQGVQWREQARPMKEKNQ